MTTRGIQLKWKISAITILIQMLIMIAVSVIIYRFTADTIRGNMRERIGIMTDYQSETLEDLISGIRNKALIFEDDSVITRYVELCQAAFDQVLAAESEDDRARAVLRFHQLLNTASYTAGNRLHSLIGGIEHAKHASLALPDGTVIADTRNRSVSDRVGYRDHVRQHRGVEVRDRFFFAEFVQTEDDQYLAAGLPLYATGADDRQMAQLEIAFSPALLVEQFETELGEFGHASLLNGDGTILNHRDSRRLGTRTENEWFLEQVENATADAERAEAERYHILRRISEQPLYLAATISLAAITAPAQRLAVIIWTITISGMLVMFTVVAVILSWQLKPLDHLLEKIGEIRHGNFDVRVNVKTDDEVGKLGKSFNSMVTEIGRLLEEVKADQQELRKAEFRTLQSQINPHFLYNTLDFVNWMSREKDFERISKMVVSLSKFFRLSLNEGNEITSVENELEHVRHYLSIQKLRYEGGFDYSFEVDKSILRCQCLKILLQPLVENSLKHGLTGIHTSGEILIRAYQSGDDVVLEVSDNGVGVDPAYIEALLAEDVGDDSSAEHTGYALRNVHKRLQLYYGEQYGLEVRSRPSGGASFLVSMPRTMNGSDALVSADNR